MRGFTLVELVVVVLLLGIIAAGVAPAVFRLADHDGLTVGATQIAAVIRSARADALAEGRSVVLMLDTVSRRYAVERDSAGMRTLTEGRIDLPSGISLVSPRPMVRFAFDRIGAAAAESVLVQGPDGMAFVGIEAWTGVSYVHRGGTE